jgi:hypothetical protein
MKKILKLILEAVSVIVAVLIVVSLVRVVRAGSLTPLALPAATMNTLQDVYNAFAGTFDSSSVAASSTGNAIALSRCAILKLTGGVCP